MVQEAAAAAAPPADAAAAKAGDEAASAAQAKPFSAPEAMAAVMSLLEKAVKSKDTRLLLGRLMRQTALVRKHMSGAELAGFVSAYLPPGPTADFLADAIKEVRRRLRLRRLLGGCAVVLWGRLWRAGCRACMQRMQAAVRPDEGSRPAAGRLQPSTVP